jgi:hypothetical protein
VAPVSAGGIVSSAAASAAVAGGPPPVLSLSEVARARPRRPPPLPHSALQLGGRPSTAVAKGVGGAFHLLALSLRPRGFLASCAALLVMFFSRACVRAVFVVPTSAQSAAAALPDHVVGSSHVPHNAAA